MRAIAEPDASASRQPRAPHAALVAVGLDDHVADVARRCRRRRRAAGRRARCRRRRRSTRPSRCSRARPRRADPTFAERERLGVVVDPHGQPGVRGQARPQRERAPRGDVERRHVLAAGVHRAAAAHADRDRAGRVEPVDEIGHASRRARRRRHRAASARRHATRACRRRARSRRELGAADVDRNDVGHKGGG